MSKRPASLGNTNAVKHGLYGTPEYNIWRGIKKRCHNPKNAAYADYGGRGVVMCESWRISVANFVADIGRRPSPLHSVDRFPDPNGNYEPGNVRWATDEEQNRNRRDYNVLVPLNGDLVTVAEWALVTAGDAHLVYERLKAGWSPEDAVAVPKRATLGQRHIGMKRSESARGNMAAAQRWRWAGRVE